MYELNPDLADRNDSNFWYVDSELRVIKPGDIVTIGMVIGERFGRFDKTDFLGMAATFLGMFAEDEKESLEVARAFIDPSELKEATPEELEGLSRTPYFRAHFDGIGELTFAGIECYWFVPEDKAEDGGPN